MFTAQYGLNIYVKFKLILTLKRLRINQICSYYLIPNYSKSGKSLNVSFFTEVLFKLQFYLSFYMGMKLGLSP